MPSKCSRACGYFPADFTGNLGLDIGGLTGCGVSAADFVIELCGARLWRLDALWPSGEWFYLMTLSAEAIGTVSTAMGNGILLLLVFTFVIVAGIRKVAVYDEFIEGAKAGFASIYPTDPLFARHAIGYRFTARIRRLGLSVALDCQWRADIGF